MTRWTEDKTKVHPLALALFIAAIILLVMAFSGIAEAVERPAPLDPNQVPYPIDVNQVQLDLLGWGDVRTGEEWNYGFRVWVPEQRVVVASGSLGLLHGPDELTRADPNIPGHPPNGWFGEYTLRYTPPTEAIRYIRLRAVVVPEDTEDGRTVVLRARDVPVPVIYTVVSPIITLDSLWNPATPMASRQRDYQRLRKSNDPHNQDVVAVYGQFNLLYPPDDVEVR
jgi:hypothetical protein